MNYNSYWLERLFGLWALAAIASILPIVWTLSDVLNLLQLKLSQTWWFERVHVYYCTVFMGQELRHRLLGPLFRISKGLQDWGFIPGSGSSKLTWLLTKFFFHCCRTHGCLLLQGQQENLSSQGSPLMAWLLNLHFLICV